MRYLKRFNENIKGAEDISLDVKDILLDIGDRSDTVVDVSFEDYPDIGTMEIGIHIENKNGFKWSDIEDDFQRASGFLSDNKWELYSIHAKYGSKYPFTGRYGRWKNNLPNIDIRNLSNPSYKHNELEDFFDFWNSSRNFTISSIDFLFFANTRVK